MTVCYDHDGAALVLARATPRSAAIMRAIVSRMARDMSPVLPEWSAALAPEEVAGLLDYDADPIGAVSGAMSLYDEGLWTGSRLENQVLDTCTSVLRYA